MLQIMCWVDSEDYWYLHSLNEKNQSLDYYGYRFEVEGGTEGIGTSSIRLLIVEFISAKMAIGFVIPKNFKLEDPDLTLRFISHEQPTNDVPVHCKISDEVKRASYMGDDQEKIEYIGFTLEKFYESHNAKFYLHDLRPPAEHTAY
ncbi:MAG TPA: hypothetical protein VHC46_09515 [Thermodesulfobacteriota bacterium]|nr:hypothetical protein [Thermodesulfobacteriota bacterium]